MKYTIFLVDDNEAFLDLFSTLPECKEFNVVTFNSPLKALDKLIAQSVDLVISNTQMKEMNGLELFHMTRELKPHTPFIMITAFGSTEQAVKAIQLGAFHYFEKPITDKLPLFWSTVRLAIDHGHKTNKKDTIFLIDDNEAFLDLFSTLPECREFNLIAFNSPKNALKELKLQNVNLIISDVQMPEMSGIDLFLKAKEINQNIPVILITAFGSTEAAKNAIEQGVFHYFEKPITDKLPLFWSTVRLAIDYGHKQKNEVYTVRKLNSTITYEKLHKLNKLDDSDSQIDFCPVCKLEKEDVQIKDYGERISFECARCGKFTITRNAAEMLGNRGSFYNLSAWIKQHKYSKNEIPEIDGLFLKKFREKHQPYSSNEKQIVLLKSFGKIMRIHGKTIKIVPHYDFPLAWASDEEEFKSILSSLIKKKLIRKTYKPTCIKDSFTSTIEITAEGLNILDIDKELNSIQHQNDNTHYDIFISHASEDKDAIARPLYRGLVKKGIAVWFDEATLKIGDSLRKKIDDGLSKCMYGIVILSPNFFSKDWPQKELDGLIARETSSGRKTILPIVHNLDYEDLARYSPTLADKFSIRSEEGISKIIKKILEVIEK